MLMDKLLAQVERPSRYIGGEIGARRKDPASVEFRVALAFPDVYEIGMSHLGYQLLYGILNDLPWCAAERVYSPWPDMEALLRREGLPLGSQETGTPLAAFDLVGFTLQYELSATGILQILDLGGIPLRAADRGEDAPLVIAGGPCAANPEPWALFFDAVFIGEGEDAIVEIARTLRDAKLGGADRREKLARLAAIPGMYLPQARLPVFRDRRLEGFQLAPGQPARVRRRLVTDLGAAPRPTAPILPSAPAVHDRLAIEVMRGCLRGCRFCFAGFFYRPVREREGEQVIDLVRAGLAESGHDEVSLLSLSTGDWSPVQSVLPRLMRELAPARVALSLPSLRAESLRGELAAAIRQVRRTGFTIAPEAATERMRRVINKPIGDEPILEAVRHVFTMGWELIKLYFMIGLPTETEADVAAIGDLVQRVWRTGNQVDRRARVNVTVSTFVPKPHTPFERFGMLPPADLVGRLKRFPSKAQRGAITFHTNPVLASLVEGAITRGDRRTGEAIEAAYRGGARFDGWREHFKYGVWEAAFLQAGLDLVAEATKTYADDEILPWDGVDIGIDPAYLRAERDRALRGETTADCRDGICKECGNCAAEIRTRLAAAEIAAPASEPAPPATTTTPPPLFRYWICFAKAGTAKWLGHLDLVRLFGRAMRRAGLPVAYSLGYHPMPRLSFGPPLAIGIAGDEEWLEAWLTETTGPAEIQSRLQSSLPEGFRLIAAKQMPNEAPSLFEAIAGWEYEIELTEPAGETAAAAAIERFLALSEYPVTVVKKGRDRVLDARQLVRWARLENGRLRFFALNPPSGMLKPTHLGALLLGLPEERIPAYHVFRRRTVMAAGEKT
ncbi:MAG: TIGR03960 family B12-binding radical SAM protein [Myxococcales bacterium]|nr:TIGR03960 family B12-binding radical SAM protein [Myxococcales bacterium]